MLYDKSCRHPKEKKYMTYNIIGFTPDITIFIVISSIRDEPEIMLRVSLEIRVNTIFTNRSSVEHIKSF